MFIPSPSWLPRFRAEGSRAPSTPSWQSAESRPYRMFQLRGDVVRGYPLGPSICYGPNGAADSDYAAGFLGRTLRRWRQSHRGSTEAHRLRLGIPSAVSRLLVTSLVWLALPSSVFLRSG